MYSNEINKLIQGIYTYKIKEIKNDIIPLIENITKSLNGNSESEVSQYNEILSLIMIALDNNDLLFLGDILKFELLPFLEK